MTSQTYQPASFADAVALAKPYKLLSGRHPDYARDRGTWAELDDLYEGGYAIARNARTYLPALVGENPEMYDARLKSAAYLNYLGQIVDYFVAALFSQELTITEAADANDPTSIGTKSDETFWATFAKDCDRKGTAYSDLLKSLLGAALLKRRGYVACDFPAVSGPAPANAADEDKLGVKRGYIYEIPVEQVIDWKVNPDTGRFAWCIINRVEQDRATPDDDRSLVTETFKVWTKEPGVDGRVSWNLYSISYKPEKPPKPEELVPWQAGSYVSFKEIPVLPFELKPALWVGNKIGCVGKEHFQRRSALIGAENKNLAAIPVYAAGPEIPKVGGAFSSAQEDENRGDNFVQRSRAKGFIVTGAEDEIYFAEPDGNSYELVDKQLEKLKDEMFRVVHQMAASISNNSASLGRSGESKAQDRASEAIVLGEFGRLVRAFSTQLYTCLGKARGEDVVWVAHGLDNYDSEDRATVIAEAVQVDAVSIPSRTFKVEYKTHIAGRMLPTLGPATKQQVRKEIEAGVDAELEMKSIADDARKDALQNPQPPAVGGKKPAPAVGADVKKNGATTAPAT